MQRHMAAQDRDRARFAARRSTSTPEPPEHDPGPVARAMGLAQPIPIRCLTIRQAIDLPMAA